MKPFRYLRLLRTMIAIRLSRQMMYRASFWTAFFVDSTLFLTQLAVFSALFLNVDTVNGWSSEQMVFFVGTFSIIDGIEMFLYFFGVLALPGHIRNGRMDLYLTKPANPLFLITFEGVDIGSLFIAIPGVLMVCWSTARMGLEVTPARVLGYLALLVLMLVLLFDLMLLLRCVSFWVTQVSALGELEDELMGFSFRVPGVVFQGAFRVVLFIFVPYAMLATIPTQFFTSTLNGGGWLTALGVTVAFTLLVRRVWCSGVRRYGSTGS